jgi:exopolyphosphatase/guanosine-5'-triphosphate,3'-diphosphate pyrophosphatase
MKLAAIDTGTNSTRLLIADVFLEFKKNIRLTPIIARQMQITRLGKNLEKTGVISKEAAEDTLKVLKKYYTLIKINGVARYRAVGTRVLRQASNSEWFKSYVYKKIGLDIEIIDWMEEARLSFAGAIKGNKIQDFCRVENCNILVVDIGGGSTEFILGDGQGNITYANSVDIGSVRLMEKFLKHDIPKKLELKVLHSFIKEKIKDTTNELKRNNFIYMVGLAGTISTLASIDLKLDNYDREKIHSHILKFEKVMELYHKLLTLNLKERKKIKGLEPKRADIIIAGTAILIEIMNMTGVQELFVSENDILDGIIYSIF